MKHLSLSLVIAAAIFTLAGAVFFASSVGKTGSADRAFPSPAVEEAVTALEERLEGIAERLDRMERKASLPGEVLAGPAAESAGAEETPPGTSVSTTSAAEASSDEQKLLAAVLRGEEDSGGLRHWVKQVIQDEREERRQNDMRLFEEERKEFEELSKGPYGQFNYRVNSLAKRLSLSESQKARYYALLADYSARFDEARKNVNREDEAEYKAYQDRKKSMMDEFEALVLQGLTLAQAEEYQNLPSFEKTPDPKHMGGSDMLKVGIRGTETAPDGGVVFFESSVGAAPFPGGPPVGAGAESIRINLRPTSVKPVQPPPSK